MLESLCVYLMTFGVTIVCVHAYVCVSVSVCVALKFCYCRYIQYLMYTGVNNDDTSVYCVLKITYKLSNHFLM